MRPFLPLALLPSLVFAQVAPSAQTAPLVSGPAAANDTAFYVAGDGGGFVIASNQTAMGITGLVAYTLSGVEVDSVNDGPARAVDVKYGFSSGGAPFDIVLEAKTDGQLQLLGPDSNRVFNNLEGTGATLIQPACAALAWRGGELFALVGGLAGQVQQWKIGLVSGQLAMTKVRDFTLPGGRTVWAMRADEQRDVVFLSIDGTGVVTLPLAPDGGQTTTLFAGPSDAGLDSAPHGLALYPESDGGALLIASDFSGGKMVVFDQDGRLLGSFKIVSGGGFSGVIAPKGAAVVPGPLGAFPMGVLAVVDPNNGAGVNSNVKLVNWVGASQAVTPPLPVDPGVDLRTLPHGFAAPDAGPVDAGCEPPDGGDAGACDGGGTGGGAGGAGGGNITIPGGGGNEPEPRRFCGCSSSGAFLGLGALMLLAVRRRRDKR